MPHKRRPTAGFTPSTTYHTLYWNIYIYNIIFNNKCSLNYYILVVNFPYAKMVLGAKHGGRPPIVSRIICPSMSLYCAFWVGPNMLYSDVLSLRSIYRIPLQIFGCATNVLINRPCVNFKRRCVSSSKAAIEPAYAVRYLHVWHRTAY